MMCPICTSWSSALNTNHVFKVSRCLLLHCLWNVRLIFSRSGGEKLCFKDACHLSPPKTQNVWIFLLACADFYPPRLFWCELPSLGDISCKLRRLPSSIQYNGTRWLSLYCAESAKKQKNKTNKEKDASEKRRRKSRNSFSYFWVGGEICGHESWSEYSKILLWAVSSGALTAWAS